MEPDMELKARLAELARVKSTAPPVVSVYLNTRWEDEHQRDRVRLFLKNELRRARQGAGPPCAEPDLEWIEAQGEALVSQERLQGARGVAMFACGTAGLREVLHVRVPFENALVLAAAAGGGGAGGRRGGGLPAGGAAGGARPRRARAGGGAGGGGPPPPHRRRS